jgi:hypothetical protein
MDDLYARTNTIRGMKLEMHEIGVKCVTPGRKDDVHTEVVLTTPEGKTAL